MNEYFPVSSSYDALAEEYVAHIYHELEYKPLDREWLARFAATMGNPGPICDLGCGPGHVARYLHEQGAHVLGVDLSPRMIELARQLNDDIEFRVGNMIALPVADRSWSGIAAFYSIIHIPRTQIATVLREFWRVLRPGGEVLLAFHVGEEVRHFDTLWEQPVSLDFIFYQRAWIEEHLRAAGFEIVESMERDPYESVEVPTQRAYIRARKLERAS
ncbi:MAG: methyltransferase domain-containing protein [Chloroflexota bacterium]|nr:methyltransferase domain-containing protein [Chloroflexota bacterium]